MKPLRYPHPMIRKDSDLTIALTNVVIHGLELTNVTDVEYAHFMTNIFKIKFN